MVAEYEGNKHTDTKLILLITWSVGEGNDSQPVSLYVLANADF